MRRVSQLSHWDFTLFFWGWVQVQKKIWAVFLGWSQGSQCGSLIWEPQWRDRVDFKVEEDGRARRNGCRTLDGLGSTARGRSCCLHTVSGEPPHPGGDSKPPRFSFTSLFRGRGVLSHLPLYWFYQGLRFQGGRLAETGWKLIQFGKVSQLGNNWNTEVPLLNWPHGNTFSQFDEVSLGLKVNLYWRWRNNGAMEHPWTLNTTRRLWKQNNLIISSTRVSSIKSQKPLPVSQLENLDLGAIDRTPDTESILILCG